MKKIHTRQGFTMAEILLTLAIIAVLAGLSTVAAYAYRENVTRLKLDGIAKEIFVAAQNHLTIANTQGLVEAKIPAEKPDTDTFTDSGWIITPQPMTGISSDAYYFRTNDNPDDPDLVLNLMLPQFSIDENVRTKGYWLLRYIPASAQVWDVFYWEDPEADLQNYDVCVGTAADNYTYTASGRKILVGHYGVGSDASGGGLPSSEIAIPTDTLDPPSLTVNNSHVLSVEIQDKIKDTNGHSIGNLRLMITGKTSHKQFVTDILTKDVDGKAVVVLDDITIGSGNRFSAGYSDKGFIPGEDLELQAWVFKDGGTSFARSETQVTNSLFAGIEDGKILVSSIRHLENLDENKSQFDNIALFPDSLTTPVQAKQIEDLDFQEFLDDASTNSAYLYSPVTPGYRLSYRGEYDAEQHTAEGYLSVPKISNVTASGDSGSYGIFGALSGTQAAPISIENLELVDCSVSATGTTISGALAGSLEWCSVKNVAAYTSDFNSVQNDDAHKTSDGTEDDAYAKITGGACAGGLVGKLTHGSLNQCASTMVVRAGDGSGAANAGGLVGQAKDVAITASYVSGHSSGEGKFITSDWQKANVYANGTSGTSGGLVGSAAGLYAENCYTTNSVSANSGAVFIGGLVGKLSPSADEPYLAGLGDAIQNRITVSSTVRNVVLHCHVMGTAYTPPATPDDAPVLHPFIGMDVGTGACQFTVNPSDTDLVNHYLVGLVSNTGSSSIADSLSPRSFKAENVIAPDASNPKLLSDKRAKATAYAKIFNSDYKGRFYYYTIAQILGKADDADFKKNNPAFLFVHYGDWQVPGVGVLPYTLENGNRLYVPVTVGDATGAQTEKIVLSVEGKTSQRLREITLEAVPDADGKITHYAPKFTEDYTISRTTDVTQSAWSGPALNSYPLNSVQVWPEGDGGDAVTKTALILDDITRKDDTDLSAHFADLFPGFIPGEELVVRVVDATVIFADLEETVPVNDGSDPTKTDPVNVTNSLFAKSVNPDQTDGTLNLSCIRHLQNLDTTVSGLDTTLIKAQNAALTADLTAEKSEDVTAGHGGSPAAGGGGSPAAEVSADWKSFTAEVNTLPGLSWTRPDTPQNVTITSKGGTTAYSNTFRPVTSPNLKNFDGGKHTIQNLVINGTGAGTNYAALFADTASGTGTDKNHMQEVKDLHLEQFTVTASADGNAGTLFPTVSTKVDLDHVLSEGETASVTAASGMAGGFIGNVMTGGTVTVSSSAATVYVNTSGAAGGLVGGQSGGTLNINQSYAGGHTKREQYTIDGYSEDDAGRWNVRSSGNAAGGLVGSVTDGTFSATESFSAASVSGSTAGGGVVGQYAKPVTLKSVYAIAPVDGVARYETEGETGYNAALTGKNAGALLGVQASGGSVNYDGSHPCYYLPEVYHNSFIGKDNLTSNISSTATGNLPTNIHLAYYSPDQDKGITAKDHSEFLEQKTSFYDSAFDDAENSGKPLNNEFPFSMWTRFSFAGEDNILHYYGDWQPVDTTPLKLTLKYAYDDKQAEKRDENDTILQQELYLRPGFDQKILLRDTPFLHLYEYKPWAVESETAKAAEYDAEASSTAITDNAQMLEDYGLTFDSVQDVFGVMRIALAAFRKGTEEPVITLVSPVERIPHQFMVEFRIPSNLEDQPGQYYTLKNNSSDAGTRTPLTRNSGYKSGAEAYRENRARTGRNDNDPLLRDIRVPDPVIEGYVFDGWFTTPDNTAPSDPANGGTMTARDFSDSSTETITANTVFYARFHAIRTYRITVDFLYDMGDSVEYMANIPQYRVKDIFDQEVAQYVIKVPVGESFVGNVALPEVHEEIISIVDSLGNTNSSVESSATTFSVSETDPDKISKEEYTAVYTVYYRGQPAQSAYYTLKLRLADTKPNSTSNYPYQANAVCEVPTNLELQGTGGEVVELNLRSIAIPTGFKTPTESSYSHTQILKNAPEGYSDAAKKEWELRENVIDVTVQRKTVTLAFNRRGGSYVKPVEGVKYGQPIESLLNEAKTTRNGYTFIAWRYPSETDDPENTTPIPDDATMPAEDLTVVAEWNLKDVTTFYTVVYWRENVKKNPNDTVEKGRPWNGKWYSYAGSETYGKNGGYDVDDEPVEAGYTNGARNMAKLPSQVKTPTKTVNTTNLGFFTFNAASDNISDQERWIQPDGSTLVNVYYDRIEYTLSFPMKHNVTRIEYKNIVGTAKNSNNQTLLNYYYQNQPGNTSTIPQGFVYVNQYIPKTKIGTKDYNSGTFTVVYKDGTWYEYTASQPKPNGTILDSFTEPREETNEEDCTYWFTAKFEEDISAKWPGSSDTERTNADGTVLSNLVWPEGSYKDGYWTQKGPFYGWKNNVPSNDSTVYVTKRFNLESQMIQNHLAQDGVTLKYNPSYNNGNMRHVHYMLQVVDGMEQPGDTQYAISGYNYRYYHDEETYYQDLILSGNLNAKAINGFDEKKAVVTGPDENDNIYLYYPRKSTALKITHKAVSSNKDDANTYDSATVNDKAQFEAPLSLYMGDYVVNGDYNQAKKPNDSTYPRANRRDFKNSERFEFEGWYDEPTCSKRDEKMDLETTIMPGDGFELYAKWVSIKVDVTFDAGGFYEEDGERTDGKFTSGENSGKTSVTVKGGWGEAFSKDNDNFLDSSGEYVEDYTPSRSGGWVFDDWIVKDCPNNRALEGTHFMVDQEIDGPMTLVPHWREIPVNENTSVTVTYGYYETVNSERTWHKFSSIPDKIVDADLMDEDADPKPTVGHRWYENSIPVSGYYPLLNQVSKVLTDDPAQNIIHVEYNKIEPWYYTAEYYLRLGHGDSTFNTAQPVMTAQFPAYNEYETVTFRFPGPDDPSTPGPKGCSEDIKNHYRFHALQYADSPEQSSSRVLIHPVKVSEAVDFANSEHKSRAVVKYYLVPDETTSAVSALESLYDGTPLGNAYDTQGGFYLNCTELMPTEISAARIQVRLDYTFYYYQNQEWKAFQSGEYPEYPTDAGIYQFDTAVNAYVPGSDDPILLWEASDRQNLIIKQREITLTSASDRQPYNADEVLKLDKPGDVTVTGDGWADGEGAEYTFSVDSFRRNKGTSYNVFNYVLWKDTAHPERKETKAQNYSISKKYGTLTVY